MIEEKGFEILRDRQLIVENQIVLKATVAVLFCLGVFQAAPLLGPIATFICLDLILSAYLTSLFHGKYSFLFLIHPVFALISSYGFEIPYTEIGTSFTFLDTFKTYVDPSTFNLDTVNLWATLFPQEGGFLGVGSVYIGTIPIIWLPGYLFLNPPDIVFYLSLGAFTMLYAAIAVSVALYLGILRKDILLIIALYSTVSPTFLEINNGLHRYGLLFLGFFLFLIAYIGLSRIASGLRKLLLVIIMLLAIVLVAVSKAPVLLSLALFVLLERLSCNKLPFFSKAFAGLDNSSRVFVSVVGIVIAQYLSTFIIPDAYLLGFSQQGGQYAELMNLPILGLVLRLVYAVLAPFPWINFDQWEIYGYNTVFLWLHFFSTLFATWVIFSLFSRMRRIVDGADDIRTTSMLGVAILSSLAFSAIGFHVYLAPALPFLAVIMFEKQNRVSLIYPVCFVVAMEIVAQVARLIR